LSKSFSGSWLAQASYTLSYLRGNYSGLFRPENGQLNPNATTEFDLAPLVVNRTGTLPGDRTHQIKLLGARDFSVTRWLTINGGLSYYARSGGPSEHFGSDPIFGGDQVFILPRGLGERLPWVHSFDTHLGATFGLSRTSALLVGVDIFNLLNFQAATSVDQRYTAAPVRPIVGGATADLPVQGADGTYSCPPTSCKLRYADGSVFDPVDRNPNHGNPTSFQPPRTIRFSAKVTF
jgi:hypothetical protein